MEEELKIINSKLDIIIELLKTQINSSKKHHRGLALELGQINSKLFSKGT